MPGKDILPYRNVVSCARLTTRPCCFDLQRLPLVRNTCQLVTVLFVRSVIQVVHCRPRYLLPSISHFINCSCVVLCLTSCHLYCNFLVFNCRSISQLVPILLNNTSLVILSVHDIFNTLGYIHISEASIQTEICSCPCLCSID